MGTLVKISLSFSVPCPPLESSCLLSGLVISSCAHTVQETISVVTTESPPCSQFQASCSLNIPSVFLHHSLHYSSITPSTPPDWLSMNPTILCWPPFLSHVAGLVVQGSPVYTCCPVSSLIAPSPFLDMFRGGREDKMGSHPLKFPASYNTRCTPSFLVPLLFALYSGQTTSQFKANLLLPPCLHLSLDKNI